MEENNYRRTLLTGGSGLLGTELRKYLAFEDPTSDELDIQNPNTIKTFADQKIYKTIIHCAAYTDVAKAEHEEKDTCFDINVRGTMNMVKAFPNSKFIYISSEYCENPVNFYSQTKLWGEEMVQKYSQNYLIIRTLFKPNPFPYEYAFGDQFTQGDYVDVIAPSIAKFILMEATGLLRIGTGRKSMYELAKRTKPDVKMNSVDDIEDVKLPKDYIV